MKSSRRPAGRLIFNGLLPEGYPFVNRIINDKELSN